MIKAIIGMYLVSGLEEDYDYVNGFPGSKKPNFVYRIYKAVNRKFRKETNAYVFQNDKINKSLPKYALRWSPRK